MENSRRKFLKNVAYKAPVVVALGTLVVAPAANASNLTPAQQREQHKNERDQHNQNS